MDLMLTDRLTKPLDDIKHLHFGQMIDLENLEGLDTGRSGFRSIEIPNEQDSRG